MTFIRKKKKKKKLWSSTFLFIILIMEDFHIHQDLTEFLLSKPTVCLHLASHHVHYMYDVMTFCVNVDCQCR